MNKQIKAIFIKEIKESLKDRKLILSIIINILIFTVMGFSIDYSLAPENSFLASIIIILYPVFSMWILSFPFIQEKFWNVKIVNGFQPLLTLPITLKEIWLGKISAIFVLSYPSTVIIGIILSLAYYLTLGINPLITIPFTIWIWIFVLGPLLIIVYNLIASWMALRFNNARVIDILQYTSVIIFIFAFVGAGKINQMIIDLHFNDWAMILIGMLIMGLFASIIYYLISNLKKEKVIT
jgi:hypothetical protein